MAHGPNLTRKLNFARHLFDGLTQTDAALAAGYSPKSTAWPCRLARDPFVVSEIARLRQEAEDLTIMDVIERKQLLSVIGRSKLSDYLNPDGTIKPLDRDSPFAAALAEMTVTQLSAGDDTVGITTKIKLHDPIRAIEILNKMEGVYSDAPSQGAPVTNNILIVAPDVLRELEHMLRAIHSSDGPLDLLGEGR